MPPVGAPVSGLLLRDDAGDARREPVAGPGLRRRIVVPPRVRDERRRTRFVDRSTVGPVFPPVGHRASSTSSSGESVILPGALRALQDPRPPSPLWPLPAALYGRYPGRTVRPVAAASDEIMKV